MMAFMINQSLISCAWLSLYVSIEDMLNDNHLVKNLIYYCSLYIYIYIYTYTYIYCIYTHIPMRGRSKTYLHMWLLNLGYPSWHEDYIVIIYLDT